MEYIKQQERASFLIKILKFKGIIVNCISLYFLGIIVQLLILNTNINFGYFYVFYAVISPASALVWRYFSIKIYKSKANIYNQFSFGSIYNNLIIFWGNRTIPLSAFILSIFLSFSTSFYYINLNNTQDNKLLENYSQNIEKASQSIEKASQIIKKASQSFEKASQIIEKASQSIEKPSQSIEKPSQSIEKPS